MVSVAILLPDIPNRFLSGAVTLTPCEEPVEEPECSDSLEMKVTNADGDRPDTDAPCLEPGRYTFRVTSPSGSAVSYSWSVDGELQPAEDDDIFDFELDTGETHIISADFLSPEQKRDIFYNNAVRFLRLQ
ncbi:MAG TPA: hypothetical protein VFI91_13595 [Longimicrobiaceae bacterium]|nr:hypothetical protein [Longimicrobiaceae bacterium]